MFFATYKNTLKTLFRSALFWVVLLLVTAIIIEGGLSVQSIRVVVVNERPVGTIMDTEPEFRQYFDHNFYVQTLQNSQSAGLMSYAMPIFAVITTMLVLVRDFNDNLFEIEKSAGTKPSIYFFGRLSALISVNFIFCLFFGFLGFHTYFYSRGGPPDFFDTFEYFTDSAVRILRVFVGAEIFTVLFFIGITYAVSCIFQSGFIGGVTGIGSVLFMYLSSTAIKHRIPTVYLNYLTPHSLNHYVFLGLYDSELFYHPLGNPFTAKDVVICVSFLFCISLAFFVLSFISTKKRTV